MKRGGLLALTGVALALGCGTTTPQTSTISTFLVTVTKVNGQDPPSLDSPLPANHGDHEEAWDFTLEAHDSTGNLVDWSGFVRLSTEPGAVDSVDEENARGRNVWVQGGKASGTAHVSYVYGETRLWAEDIGYAPAPAGKIPECSDGIDNNGNVLVDYPVDPGCAYADDDSEDPGSYATGVSQSLHYQLPKISDVQGDASTTPYPNEAITINAASPEFLIVTRVGQDGFNVTDITEQAKGYNHIFAFNFSTPEGMRVCDRVTLLSGTVNEFFGFTELSFPSFELRYPIEGKDPCLVPDPVVLLDTTVMPTVDLLNDPVSMEKQESGIVRVKNVTMPSKFGPGLVKNNMPDENDSNCDLNGDGAVDFESPDEGACASACEDDPTCSEWTDFEARSEIKVHDGGALIQLDLSAVTEFDPTANKGLTFESVTGALREFSGGNLNWTVQARCSDDVVCTGPMHQSIAGCSPAIIESSKACVKLRTQQDNDQGTN